MVDGFFRKMKDAIVGSDEQFDQDAEYDQQVTPASQDPYGDPGAYGQYGDVTPASQDPYGDPGAYGQYGDVRPASEDPNGDPGAYGQYGDVRPASEDPYGDPADQENQY